MWTAESGMVGLGDLPGGSYSSWANGGVNHDGSVIVDRRVGIPIANERARREYPIVAKIRLERAVAGMGGDDGHIVMGNYFHKI